MKTLKNSNSLGKINFITKLHSTYEHTPSVYRLTEIVPELFFKREWQ